MDTVSVNCNSCGAPLQVGAQARFVTCQFCHTQLEIKRTDSSLFTEEMSQVARNTEQMAQSLEAIKLQNEIEMLDREAATLSEPSSRSGRSGSGGAMFGLVFAVFFAFVCFGMAGKAGRNGAPGLFGIVPIGMGLFAIAAAVMALAKSSTQTDRQEDLRRRRDELTRKLAEINSPNQSARAGTIGRAGNG